MVMWVMASVPSVPVCIVIKGIGGALTWQEVLGSLLLLYFVLYHIVASWVDDGLIIHEEDRVLNLVVHTEEVVRRN
jgi:hypothetical protein